MRGAIAWSYELLEATERELLRRLAVFHGGAALEAITSICTPGATELDVLQLLQTLMDQSLVQRQPGDEPRYDMLETLREFLLEDLAACGEAEAMREQHAAFYVALTDRAGNELGGPRQTLWLRRLDLEYANLAEVLRWTLQQRDWESGLRLITSLGPYWSTRGHTRELLAWLETCVAAEDLEHRVPDQLRAAAFQLTAQMAVRVGDYALARSMAVQAWDISRAAADARGTAIALHHLADAEARSGETAAAVEHYLECGLLHLQTSNLLAAAQALGGLCELAEYEPAGVIEARALEESRTLMHKILRDLRRLGPQADAPVLTVLGKAAFDQHDDDLAWDLYKAALAKARAGDDRAHLAIGHNMLGELAFRRGDYVTAADHLARSEVYRRECDDVRGTMYTLRNLAAVAYVQSHYARAADYLVEAYGVAERIRDVKGIADVLCAHGLAALRLDDLDEAIQCFAQSLAKAIDLGDRERCADALGGVATVAAAQHRYEWCAQLLAAAALEPSPRDADRALDHLTPIDYVRREVAALARPTLVEAREVLGEAKFASCWQTGLERSHELIDNVLAMALGSDAGQFSQFPWSGTGHDQGDEVHLARI
jgi:tetratricopeptide (TPR) repeat protein